MVIEVRSSGGQGKSVQENNQQSFAFDTHISGTTGRHRVYVHILSTETAPSVRLYLYGMTTNMPIIKHNHDLAGTIGYTATGAGAVNHTHSLDGFETERIGNYPEVNNIWLETYGGTVDVPQEVTIYIDGVEKTATIGDANSKGATMYDSTNDDWGINGTTEWSTGELNLTSIITWSKGEHYIELRCAGKGGRLLGNIYIN